MSYPTNLCGSAIVIDDDRDISSKVSVDTCRGGIEALMTGWKYMGWGVLVVFEALIMRAYSSFH